jgi:uncharacterized membrane protein YdbT with pleckstrin-like domain
MSYVDKNLMPSEKVIYRTHLHWVVFLWPILWFVVAIWLYSAGVANGSIFATLVLLLIAFPMLFDAFVARRTSEFAVTNKRVLIKTGLIRRHSLETLLNKIEGIHVEQGILGRIVDYGTIIITGTGGSKEPFHRIANPMEFRRRVQEQIVAVEESRTSRNV